MTLWQTQQMEEDARNRKWEEMNEENPADEAHRCDAVSSLQVAINYLSKAWDWIYQAVDDVDGLPEADEIESFEEEVHSIQNGLERMQNKLRYGWR